MNINNKLARRAKLFCAASILPAVLFSASVACAAAPSSNEEFSPMGVTKVDLGAAGGFAILSKSGITDVPTSAITGNVGTSPITGAADHLTCTEVSGKVFSVDAAGPAPCSIVSPSKLTTAVGDMQTAYTDAAGRPPKFNDLAGGNIGGLTLKPGVYNWTSDVNILSDVTLKGDSHAVWVFQIAGRLKQAKATAVILAMGAQPQNVFWQVANQTTVGTGSHLEGIVLGKTAINLATGASINGRLLSQTAVTLQMNAVTAP